MDFITVDGAEGGTGAAPPEFSNHIGLPLVEGLVLVDSLLTGANIRDKALPPALPSSLSLLSHTSLSSLSLSLSLSFSPSSPSPSIGTSLTPGRPGWDTHNIDG